MLNANFSFEWSPKPKLHFAVALSLCIGAGIVALLLYKNATDSLASAIVVNGVVVESRVGGEGMHTPLIEYEDSQGRVARFYSRLSSRPQKYFRGDKVEVVLYEGGARPELRNFFTIYGLPAFAAIFSFISLLGAIAVYYERVRPRTGI